MLAVIMGTTATPLASAVTETPGIMHVYLMNDQNKIAGTIPVPVGNENPSTASMSGFRNTTVNEGGATLVISRSVGKIILAFSDDGPSGTTMISTLMEQLSNPSKDGQDSDRGQWIAVIQADYTPKSHDVQLGDAFLLNFTSPLSGQYRGLQNGLLIVSKEYRSSSNGDDRTLGSYYEILANEVPKMESMIPSHIISIEVKNSVGLGTDDLICTLETTVVTFVICTLVGILCAPGGLLAFACALFCVVYFSYVSYWLCYYD